TAPEAGAIIARYVGADAIRLSPAALETLAIVAYRQPVTKAAIERIRGVDSDYTVRTLLHRRLVTELGRSDSPGRPILYGTGFDFLERFGLTSLEELPPLDVDVAARLAEEGGEGIAIAAGADVPVVLHKPPGVTSTARDRHAARTVVSLIPRDLAGDARLYPVGRLDQDSEGLILLTNDGPWADAVLHPSHGVEREYAIAVRHPLDVDQGRALERGIELEEGTARLHGLREQTRTETRRLAELLAPPVDARLVWYRATLEHGWKRQL